VYDSGDASLYSYSIVEREKVGCKIRFVFGDEEVCCDTSDGTWDAYWSKFLWIVDIFVKGDEIDGVDVGTFIFAKVGVCDV